MPNHSFSGRTEMPEVSERWPRIALLAGWGVFAAAACLFVAYGETWYDEGGYLYESWLVCAKGWMPFRDFWTRVPPLIYLVYGLPQRFLGPSVLVGRVEAALLTAIALWLLSRVAHRLGGSWAPPLLLLGVSLSWRVMRHQVAAVAVPVAGLWVALALYLLLVPRRPRNGRGTGPQAEALPLWRLYGAGVCAGALALSRHDLIALYGGLGVYIAALRAPLRHRLGALLAAVALFVFGLQPMAAQAPEEVARALTAGVTHPPFDPATHPLAQRPTASVRWIAWYAMMASRDLLFALLLAVPALAYFWRATGGESLWSRLRRRPDWLLLGWLAVGNRLLRSVGAALTGGPAFYLQGYYTAVVLFTLAAALMGRLLMRESGAVRRSYLALVGLGLVLQVAVVGKPEAPGVGGPTFPTRVRQAAEALRRHSAPTDRILALEHHLVCLEAQRVVFPPLTQPGVSFTTLTEGQGKRHTEYNVADLERWLSREADVVLTGQQLEQTYKEFYRDVGGPALWALISRHLQRDFELAETVADSGYGDMRIWVRRSR